MFKILIVDDNVYKITDIRNALISLNEEDIVVFKCAKECQKELSAIRHKEKEPYDIVFLDMQFPFYKGERVEINMGERMIPYFKKSSPNTKIILCSSDDYSNAKLDVYDTLHYSDSVDMTFSIKKILDKIKKES